MTWSLQLWVLAGLLVGGGAAMLVWALRPAHPDLAQALARLGPANLAQSNEPGHPPAGWHDRVGLWAMRYLPAAVWRAAPNKDLQVLGMSQRAYYGEKASSRGRTTWPPPKTSDPER